MAVIYDLPEKDYFNPTSPRFGIHAMLDFRDKGARYFYKRHIDRSIEAPPSTEAQEFGKSAHKLTLEGQQAYEDYIAIQPETYIKAEKLTKKDAKSLGWTNKTEERDDRIYLLDDDGFYYTQVEAPWNGNANECKLWKSQQDGKHIIDKIDDYKIQGMNAAIMEYDETEKLLHHSVSEVTIYHNLETEYGELPVQIRIDSVQLLGPDNDPSYWLSLNDYKTCESLGKFKKDLKWLNYYVQAAFYTKIVREELKLDLPWNFIAQEKSQPYRIGVYDIDYESMDMGMAVLEYLIPAVAKAYNNNEWPIGHEYDTLSIEGNA